MGTSIIDIPGYSGRRSTAEAELRLALRHGRETSGIRKRLDDLARAEAVQARGEYEARLANEEREKSRHATAAGEHVAAFTERLTTTLAELAVPEGMTMDLANVEYAAADLARTRESADQATTSFRAAEGEVRSLTERLVQLTTARATIVQRRTAGQAKADDGPNLALLDADREGLDFLLTEAKAAVEASRAPVRETAAAHALAAKALTRAEASAEVDALNAHAAELDAAMAGTLAKLGTAQKRLGDRPSWIPRRGTIQAMQMLAGQRPDLTG